MKTTSIFSVHPLRSIGSGARVVGWVALLALSLGCRGKTADSAGASVVDSGLADSGDGGALPDVAWAFESALTGRNSVAYSGQVFRHLLIDDLSVHLGGVTDRINNGALFPVAGDISDELTFYLEFDSSVGGEVPIYTSPDPGALQAVYNDISSGKNLVEKLAGNDPTGQHRDWSTELVGWSLDGVSSPEAVVRSWVAAIDAQAVAWGQGDLPLDPSGAPVPAVFVSPEGIDHRQLLQKFLRGAVAFSQGTDDYLDDDLAEKGLQSDHTVAVDGEAYTSLEHSWDEAFGYFGAAASYPDWTDDQIADTPGRDVNGDGAVDLLTEMNWGHSVNAAKRDRGAVVVADFTAQAWRGFFDGRQLLAETAGAGLTAEQQELLASHRDTAVGAWEAAIAATVVHYINDTLRHMGTFGSDAYHFGDHAKHWSELKGFALSFQFNPRSPMSATDFAALHGWIGQAPVLPTASPAEQEAYIAALLEARALIGTTYGFDAANLGDEDGENGW